MTGEHEPHFATVLDLVSKVYEAAADASMWPQFLQAFADATNSEGTIIWLHDLADTSARIQDAKASFVSNVRIDDAYLTSYASHYTHVNVLLSKLDALEEGTTMLSSSVVSDLDLHKTEYYCDWLRPQGLGYCLGGPIVKRGDTVAMFSTQRLEERGCFGHRELLLAKVLMPHLRRACLLHQRLTRLRAEEAGAIAALDLLTCAVWLLDSAGRLLHANRAGRELNERRDGIWLDAAGRPIAYATDERDRLRMAISSTMAAQVGQSARCDDALLISRRSQAAPLQVLFYPLASTLLADEATVAMFIFDPARQALPDRDVLSALYGLTKTEARLAVAIASGESLTKYCEANSVTINTARTHLKHVLSKTGARRQAELVSIVAKCSGWKTA